MVNKTPTPLFFYDSLMQTCKRKNIKSASHTLRLRGTDLYSSAIAFDGNCVGETMRHYHSLLAKLKARSIRRGIWHRTLNRMERIQVWLTLRLVKRVRSPSLAKVLDGIVGKLVSSLQSRVLNRALSMGASIAFKHSSLALDWGYEEAEGWVCDKQFALFLGLMCVNSTPSVDDRRR